MMEDALLPESLLDRRYRISALINVGGMGCVYRAWSVFFGEWVAVKVPRARPDRQACSRFLLEARATRRIRHPNVVEIRDFGELPDGRPYLVMELLEGRPLADLIRAAAQGGIAPHRVCLIGQQIAAALQAVHDNDILHRDLKPDNVLLLNQASGDRVKVVDFGVAKLMNDRRATLLGIAAHEPAAVAGASPAPLTINDMILGTPHYMSPEQTQGLPLGRQSDQYALGCILYEMLCGSPPFDLPPGSAASQDATALMRKHVSEAPVPLRQRRPDLATPAALDALVLRALAKRPQDRFPSMAALADELGRLAQQLRGPDDAAADPTQTLARGAAPGPRRRALAILAAASLLLLGGAVAARWRDPSGTRRATVAPPPPLRGVDSASAGPDGGAPAAAASARGEAQRAAPARGEAERAAPPRRPAATRRDPARPSLGDGLRYVDPHILSEATQ